VGTLHNIYQPKQQYLEWRRSRVLDLSSQGKIEREIAQILEVGRVLDLTTDGVVITNDIKFVQNSKEKLIMSNRGQGVKRTGP
jgi:hypothetical protein